MSPGTRPPAEPRRRADALLVERGLAESRARAQALIMAGLVYAGERRVEKPGQLLPTGADVVVRGRDHPWVSRGGIKLAHGLARFGFSPADRTCLDIGASTGGFVDVLLSHGARRVHAVDVGHGQLAWKLRTDSRVIVHERTNARFLTEREIPEPVQALTCDASFIGLETVLPAALRLTTTDAWAIALIKPEFEAGPAAVGRGGVVRDPECHRQVCRRIEAWWAALDGWRVIGVTESPIQGPAGNHEFLIGAERDGT